MKATNGRTADWQKKIEDMEQSESKALRDADVSSLRR